MQGKNLILTVGCASIYPGNPIIGKMIDILLPKVDDGAAHRCYRQNEQQRANELGLKIPQTAVSADDSPELNTCRKVFPTVSIYLATGPQRDYP
jgi:hypothetical protein